MFNKLVKMCGESFDIVSREITIGQKKVSYVYSETLSSSDSVTDFLLKPISNMLLLNQNKVSSDFEDLIKNSITGASCKKVNNLDDAVKEIFNGHTVLVIDDSYMLAVETKATLDRGITEAEVENSIAGPKDAFGENLNKNVGLIRKRIRNHNLIVKTLFLGNESNTKIAISYMDDIADKSLVNKVLERAKEIKNDIIIDGGYVTEEFSRVSFLPEVNQTERPDLASFALLEGKVCLLVDNSPTVLIIPTFFIDFFHTADDYYQKNINTTFIRILRFIAFLIAIFLPGYYISITTYNPTSIPTDLLMKLISQHTSVPFPAFFEILIMIIAFEILRESDIRIPNKVGSSTSILGGLILGDAAVSAGIISPIMIIVVAISSISSLIFPYNSMINLIRYYRYFVLVLAILFGLYGIFIGFALLIINISSITSFGYPYTYPFVPFIKNDIKDSLIKADGKKLRNPLIAKKINR